MSWYWFISMFHSLKIRLLHLSHLDKKNFTSFKFFVWRAPKMHLHKRLLHYRTAWKCSEIGEIFETEIFKTKSNIIFKQDLPFYWLALWWQTLKDFCRLGWIAVIFFNCSLISDRNIWNMASNRGKLDERLVWRCRDPIMGMVRLCCQRWWDNHGETEQRLEGRVPVGDYPYCLPPLSRARYPHTSSRRHIFS